MRDDEGKRRLDLEKRNRKGKEVGAGAGVPQLSLQ